VQRFLVEVEYWFNRPVDLPNTIRILAYVALMISPMPKRLLKLRLA